MMSPHQTNGQPQATDIPTTARNSHGRQRWVSKNGLFTICEPEDGAGYVLFNERFRIPIPDLPIVLLIRKRYTVVEKRIAADDGSNKQRFRLLQTCYDIFVRYALAWSEDGQRTIVELARSAWTHGHPLLAMIAKKCSPAERTHWSPETTHAVFGDGYFAHAIPLFWHGALERARIEREWMEQGRQRLPYYFARFGLISADSHLKAQRIREYEEAQDIKGRPTRRSERECIQVLADALRLLHPELVSLLSRRRVAYRVAKTRLVMTSRYVKELVYRPKVYLCEQIFGMAFSRALALFAREHADILSQHICPYFTNAMAELIEAAISRRQELDAFEQKWNQAHAAVQVERLATGVKDATQPADQRSVSQPTSETVARRSE